MLYRAKNREKGRGDAQLDRWFLLASLIVPLSIFVLRTHPTWVSIEIARWAPYAGLSAYALLAAVWIARQVSKYFAGAPVNWPKLWLFVAVVPLQWLALLHASHYGPDGMLRAGIGLRMFHGLQYHRVVWFTHRNRYPGPGGTTRNG